MTAGETLLEISDVKKTYNVAMRAGLLPRVRHVRALRGVSVSVARGETVAIVGESGCGKSTLARLVLALERPDGGEVIYKGDPVRSFRRGSLRTYRKSVQAVFQDPYSSLNPRMPVWEIVMEPLLVQRRVPRAAAREEAVRLLGLVGLGADAATRYAHQFSGGQRQRIAVARALSVSPDLVVLDEPVSALDVSVRAQTLNLLSDIKRDLGIAFLFISHDLAVVAHFADSVYVMYLGEVVESGPVDAVFRDPKHPYTRALLAAVPAAAGELGARDVSASLIGEIASADAVPAGCAFHPRCPKARSLCATDPPEAISPAPGLSVSCHIYSSSARYEAAESLTGEAS